MLKLVHHMCKVLPLPEDLPTGGTTVELCYPIQNSFWYIRHLHNNPSVAHSHNTALLVKMKTFTQSGQTTVLHAGHRSKR